MAQPDTYNRQYNFTAFSTEYPSEPIPGVQIDAEFNKVKTTLDQSRANGVLIQNDDGTLRNGIVRVDTLSAEALVALGGSFSVRGAWGTGTSYAIGDLVVEGTSTYVCALTHTSGTFETDLAAVKWVLIFGELTANVPDNSVTTTKIADGAVTGPKIGFTELALTGSISAVGGLVAGDFAPGSYIISGRATVGDSIAYVARATQAQGDVGFRIGGGTGGTAWEIYQHASVDNLSFYSNLSGLTVGTMFNAGHVEWSGLQRVMGNASALVTTGAGIEIFYGSNVGSIQSYDRTGSAWKDLSLSGLKVNLYAGGIKVLTATSTSVDMLDATLAGAHSVGYRDKPQNAQNNNYTLALGDRGRHVYSANTGAQTVTIPANATVAFPIGTTIDVVNNGNTGITLAIAADTLSWAGSSVTGSRSIPIKNSVTLLKVTATKWIAKYAAPLHFRSGALTVAVNTTAVIPHGLGARPNGAYATLECIATEHGYSVGEEITMSWTTFAGGVNPNGVSVSIVDAANLRYVIPSSGGYIYIISAATMSYVTLTPAKWALRLYANLDS